MESKRFDQAAEHWETPQRARRAEDIARALLEDIPEGGVGEAMEYGCGTGLVGGRVAPGVRRLTLWDASEGMVRKAREMVAREGLANARAQVRDLLLEPPADAPRFDWIFSSMVLHHMEDIPGLLERFAALLRPDGLVSIVDLMPVDEAFHAEVEGFRGHHGIDPQRLGSQAEAVGLWDIRVREAFHGVKQAGAQSVPYTLFLLTAKK